ncbi:glutamyl-tRNA(Gln) amidotransferase, B subunit [Thermovibrio ammonificans HB-1]|uniref:Aspartyl/glutamyl-tRNA(Asn/Gln) amidotransferase subunit B n=1 Tax=Thermovibrio ammonificans (strain DSM 15698 / JCM 12110 / HB-1) TaxID=648996 RepID=E8T2K7_THEA1|nr:Asp-tRNA(Asn)/Glu-tRNA(Gln) amidotransferase subunit GatB [Thermovibrio ammonificans]ADU97102.1 glutamyl-tRNA(Gln) amidotransferase, B subunit [Thermovibrio ammonificans HB-1]
MEFEAVIGLEVHAQLLTKTKIFCSCKNEFGAPPNTNVCPVCLGMPGALPVLNKRAVEFAVKAALALNCKINTYSVFARKHYFYPDLPKAYQITQYELPFAENGWVEIEKSDGTKKRIRIRRIHMEEDAGKTIHGEGFDNNSYVDLNRAGTPLIEIVSEPDISTPEEARLYMQKLRDILVWIGVNDGNLEEGSLRCDANVSIRPKGSKELGTRTEIKNVNSFRFIQKALEYEIERQIKVVKSGGEIVQETRLFDSQKGITKTMRTKEEAEDYRYFPEPDLPPLIIDKEWLDAIRESLPELPDQVKERFVSDYGLTPYDASVLVRDRALATFFEEAAKAYSGEPKKVANILISDLLGALNEAKLDIADSPVKPEHLAQLLELVDREVISLRVAKEEVIPEMVKSGKEPKLIVEEKGLVQISDESALTEVIKKVFANNEKAVKQYKEGNEKQKKKAVKFLIGQVMKETRGKANPKLLNELIPKLLEQE